MVFKHSKCKFPAGKADVAVHTCAHYLRRDRPLAVSRKIVYGARYVLPKRASGTDQAIAPTRAGCHTRALTHDEDHNAARSEERISCGRAGGNLLQIASGPWRVRSQDRRAAGRDVLQIARRKSGSERAENQNNNAHVLRKTPGTGGRTLRDCGRSARCGAVGV